MQTVDGWGGPRTTQISSRANVYLSNEYIQPSENEPWGLVINEAMACGLPILAGKTIGSAIDLVEDGVNGYILPDLEQKTISSFFRMMIANSSKLKEMGQNSREKIRDWSYENCKHGVAEILRHNGYSI